MADDKSKGGIQVIARAASVLRALRQSEGGMSLAQIAEAVDLPRSTVQRIVAALQDERMVISALQGSGVRIGPEMQSFAEAARYNIVESYRPILTELSKQTGETADLSVLRGAGMIFLDQVSGSHRLRTVSAVGEVFPLTTTANGKACLALMDPDRADDLIKAEWDRRAYAGDLNAFQNELAEIRRSGLAYDLSDHTQGICAIGVGFRDWSGELHAISIPVPSSRFETGRDKVEMAMLNVRDKLSQFVTR